MKPIFFPNDFKFRITKVLSREKNERGTIIWLETEFPMSIFEFNNFVNQIRAFVSRFSEILHLGILIFIYAVFYRTADYLQILDPFVEE